MKDEENHDVVEGVGIVLLATGEVLGVGFAAETSRGVTVLSRLSQREPWSGE